MTNATPAPDVEILIREARVRRLRRWADWIEGEGALLRELIDKWDDLDLEALEEIVFPLHIRHLPLTPPLTEIECPRCGCKFVPEEFQAHFNGADCHKWRRSYLRDLARRARAS